MDQRQVDLDDVEAELAQQPQAGIAGTHVVGGHADAGALDADERSAQSLGVADALALRQLQRDSIRGHAVPAEDGQEGRGAELGRLQRARRDVDAEAHPIGQVAGAAQDDVERVPIEVGDAAGDLGRVEHRACVREG